MLRTLKPSREEESKMSCFFSASTDFGIPLILLLSEKVRTEGRSFGAFSFSPKEGIALTRKRVGARRSFLTVLRGCVLRCLFTFADRQHNDTVDFELSKPWVFCFELVLSLIHI